MFPNLRRSLRITGTALAIAATWAGVAHAATINVPCNVAALATAIDTVGTNGEEDFVWLAPSCVYALTATFVIDADLGNPVWIFGRGAALSGQQQRGILVVATGATLHLDDVTLRDGKLTGNVNGGALRNQGITTMKHSTVSLSSAESAGGGIHNRGTLRIVDSTVASNTAFVQGGGIDNLGRLTLMESTVASNVGSYGGGIRNSGSAALFNSTVRGNGGFLGGGILNGVSAVASLNNVTIADNAVSGTDGGTGVRNEGQLQIENSILADSDGGLECVNLGSITAAGGNLIEDGSCAIVGALTGDPRLDGPSGKPAHYQLQAGSIAIDVSDKSNCPGVDQRGKRRPTDGDGDGVNECDLGSVERPAQGDCGLVGIEPFLLLPFVRMLRRRATR